MITLIGYTVAHDQIGKSTFPALVRGLITIVGVFVPLLAVLLGYKSISRERTNGSMQLTLTFPNRRRDVVIGKFVARSVVLLIPVVTILLLTGGIGIIRYGSDGLLVYPWFLVVTSLYGSAFLGLSIGVSMSTTVDRRITFGAVGTYILLVHIWDNIHSMILLILHRFDSQVLSNMPDWALLFRLLKPSEAYYRLLQIGFDMEQAALYVGEEAPLFLDWWVAVVILIAWCLLPLIGGYRRFEIADL